MYTSKSSQSFAAPAIPELEQSKKAVLDSLVSEHSRRAYKHAIEAFTAWYCSEPRIGFNRLIVVRYRSFLETQSLSPGNGESALIGCQTFGGRGSRWRLAECGVGDWNSTSEGSETARPRIGNWLNSDQAQELLRAVPRIRSAAKEMRRYSVCCSEVDFDAQKSWRCDSTNCNRGKTIA